MSEENTERLTLKALDARIDVLEAKAADNDGAQIAERVGVLEGDNVDREVQVEKLTERVAELEARNDRLANICEMLAEKLHNHANHIQAFIGAQAQKRPAAPTPFGKIDDLPSVA